MTQTDVEYILKQIDKYVKQSAKYASEHFTRNNISLGIFEGISTDMTPEFCERLYKELITDLIKAEKCFGSNYSLYAALNPRQSEDGSVVFSIQLGIAFPFLQPDSGE